MTDSTSPFVLDVSELRGPEHLHAAGSSPERIGRDMIAIPSGAEITIDAMITPLDTGMLVDAEVTAPVVGTCSRCLKELRGRESFHVSQLFGEQPDEDQPAIVDDRVDLLQSVRDEVGLALPFNPVCEDGCPEITIPVSGETRLPDPRWAGLEKFL